MLKLCWPVLLPALFCACSGKPVVQDSTLGAQRAPSATALVTRYFSIPYKKGSLELRVGIEEPQGRPEGDIIYVHGFGDRLDNHAPLFQEWTRRGFRVISFDLPSHGENRGSYNDINNFDFAELAELVVKVEKEYAPPATEQDRPLLLAGWSTGGLIMVRLMQLGHSARLTRSVKGLLLFAPGVSVRKTAMNFGDGKGYITLKTLTHNPAPPHAGPVHPRSPFEGKLLWGFSRRLAINSFQSSHYFPVHVPTLVFAGGESEDRYAWTKGIKKWVNGKNKERAKKGKDPIIGIQCPGAMHELDNELPEYGGAEVRTLAARFAASFARQEPSSSWPSPENGAICRGF